MKRIHIPNLFYIQGMPIQGKSSLACTFRQTLDTTLLATDVLFRRWALNRYPAQTANARRLIGIYFNRLPHDIKRAWREYLTAKILSHVRYGRPDIVVEGWLLSQHPLHMKKQIGDSTNLLTVVMNHFTAIVGSYRFAPVGRNYAAVADSLRSVMTTEKTKLWQPYLHEDPTDDLPDNLTGKAVLLRNCGYGSRAIACYSRGASKIYATDTNKEKVIMASRIANAIYRLPNIRFYYGDPERTTFKRKVKFDYVF